MFKHNINIVYRVL